MLYIIACKDKPGVLDQRMAAIPAHIDYVGQQPLKVVMSGPLVEDDGETVNGSFFIIEADTRAQADAFNRNDPLYAADIWSDVMISAFNKRVG